MDDIFQTNLIILIAYPGGASGKFLLNSLCFNNRFALQHVMADKLNVNEQIQLILQKMDYWINSQDHTWNDLDMGCYDLFNCENRTSNDSYTEEEVLNTRNNINKKKIQNIICQNKHFFKVTHSESILSFYKAVWPNAKIIQLTDCAAWIRMRNKRYIGIDQNYQIKNMVKISDMDTVKFSCNNFLEWKSFYDEYCKLLGKFDSEPQNFDHLRSYYNDYMKNVIGIDQ